MALVVENGSGMLDAESYTTVAGFKSYCNARGHGYGADDVKIEQALRRATAWLDATYRGKFIGRRKNGRNQALEWPRIEAYDRSCPTDLLPSDEIPREVIEACCEAAVREVRTAGSLNPDQSASGAVKRTRVGDVETEFAGATNATKPRPLFGIIDGLLSPVLKGGGNALFGNAVRA